MRELKFRIWDNLTNKMYYEALIGNCRGESTVPCVYVNEIGWAHTDNCVVEQFTGLIDKNGKEIYEGDIVRLSNNPIHDGMIVVCEWFENTVMFAYKFITGRYTDKHTDMVDSWRDYEVIGNIHDNPELLKEKQ